MRIVDTEVSDVYVIFSESPLTDNKSKILMEYEPLTCNLITYSSKVIATTIAYDKQTGSFTITTIGQPQTDIDWESLYDRLIKIVEKMETFFEKTEGGND